METQSVCEGVLGTLCQALGHLLGSISLQHSSALAMGWVCAIQVHTTERDKGALGVSRFRGTTYPQWEGYGLDESSRMSPRLTSKEVTPHCGTTMTLAL